MSSSATATGARRDPAARRSPVSAVARGAVIVLVAAGGALGAASPATAGEPVIVNDHFVDSSDSHIEQEFHEDFCPDVPFQVLWEGRVSANFQIRTRGLDGPEYYSDRAVTDNVYTNVENGKWLRSRVTFRGMDQKLTLDGDILSGRWATTISVRITASDGSFVGQESGRQTFDFMVDLNDLEDPDDDEFLGETVSELTGRDALPESDLCSDLLTYLS